MPGATPAPRLAQHQRPGRALVGQSIGRREEKARERSAPGPPNGALFPPRTDQRVRDRRPRAPRGGTFRRRARRHGADGGGRGGCAERARKRHARLSALRACAALLRRSPRPSSPARGCARGCATAPLGSSPASPAALASPPRRPSSLLERDEKAGGEAKRGGVPLPELLPRVEPSEMEDAAALIASEVAFVRSAMGHSEAEAAEYLDAAMAVRGRARARRWRWRRREASENRVERVGRAPRSTRGSARRWRRRRSAQRSSSTVGRPHRGAGEAVGGAPRLCYGYSERPATRGREEKAAYAGLHEQEQRTAPTRMETLMELAAGAREREAKLQATYAAARDELAKAERALEARRGGA